MCFGFLCAKFAQHICMDTITRTLCSWKLQRASASYLKWLLRRWRSSTKSVRATFSAFSQILSRDLHFSSRGHSGLFEQVHFAHHAGAEEIQYLWDDSKSGLSFRRPEDGESEVEWVIKTPGAKLHVQLVLSFPILERCAIMCSLHLVKQFKVLSLCSAVHRASL